MIQIQMFKHILLQTKKQWISMINVMITDILMMMTSSNANIFCVTGTLWGEFTGHGWISLTKASDTELWCFFLYAPEQTIGWTIETPVICDAVAPIITSL